MLITDLDQASDSQQVGRKAAGLNRLIQAGFDVPPGAVLTTAAFEVTATNVTALDPRGVIRELTDGFPDHLKRVALAAAADIGGPLAVRSSAIGEDGEARSHAGQYHSALNCASPAEIIAAIVQCWASAFSQSAAVYRGGTDVPVMPVLLQAMVKPTFSGVMFTIDPVLGDPSKVAIEVIPGDPAQLCEGSITPHSFVVDKLTFDIRRHNQGGIDPVPTDEVVKQVAATGIAIQQELSTPQDIEWALTEDRMTILQSRPITVHKGKSHPSVSNFGTGFIDTATIFGTA